MSRAEELLATIREAEAELAALDAAKRAARDEQARQRWEALRALLDQPEALNVLAPEHAPSRYRRPCTDDNPVGHVRWLEDPKEYDCLRCRLIEIRDGEGQGATTYTFALHVDGVIT